MWAMTKILKYLVTSVWTHQILKNLNLGPHNDMSKVSNFMSGPHQGNRVYLVAYDT